MLATRIDEIEIKDGQKGFEKPFSYFVQLLHSINIDQNSVHQPVSVLEGAQLLLENDGGKTCFFNVMWCSVHSKKMKTKMKSFFSLPLEYQSQQIPCGDGL